VGVCVFFLLLPGTGGRSYTWNFFFPFAANNRRRKLHRELFFLLLPGTEEEEVTHGIFFPFAARDRRGGSYTWNFFSFWPLVSWDLDGQTDIRTDILYIKAKMVSVRLSVSLSVQVPILVHDLDGRTGPGLEIEVPRWKRRRTTTTNGGRNNFI
jgi:hypothetical protein